MSRSTKLLILDAAESLFASQGFTQTSMRAITAVAGVNLASVNYHFGSKKNLIQAVFKRYFDRLMPLVDEQLASLPAQSGAKGVEALFQSLIPPLLTLSALREEGTETFVQLLGRGYNETQGHLRRFIMQDYGDTVTRLVQAIHDRLPDMPDDVLFWRLHFAMGSIVFSMASSQALAQIAQSDFEQQVTVADVIAQLVPFIAQGIAGQSIK